MVPHAAPLHPAPLTPQVTDVFGLPVTIAVVCWVAPTATVVLVGDTEIAKPASAVPFRVAVLLVAPADAALAALALPLLLLVFTFARPEHPEREKTPKRTTRKVAKLQRLFQR